MERQKKAIASVGALAMLGVAGVVGLNAAHHTARAEAATASSLQLIAQDHLIQLDQNRADLEAQQKAERAEGRAAFEMPAGSDFSPAQPFEEIDSQTESLESSLRRGAVSATEVEETTLSWYEGGYFTSLMAIDWKCAWLKTGVAQVQASDPAGAASTVETLHSFAATEYADDFPDYDVFLHDLVDPLLEGDITGALEYVPNCEGLGS